MSRRRHLARVDDLRRLQSVERDLAALEHAEAANKARTAREAADRAVGAAAIRAEAWLEGRASGRLEPELDALAAAALVRAEERAAVRLRDAASADAARGERADAWRLTDTRHRSLADMARETRRMIDRAEDETRLELASMRALDHRRRP